MIPVKPRSLVPSYTRSACIIGPVHVEAYHCALSARVLGPFINDSTMVDGWVGEEHSALCTRVCEYKSRDLAIVVSTKDEHELGKAQHSGHEARSPRTYGHCTSIFQAPAQWFPSRSTCAAMTTLSSNAHRGRPGKQLAPRTATFIWPADLARDPPEFIRRPSSGSQSLLCSYHALASCPSSSFFSRRGSSSGLSQL